MTTDFRRASSVSKIAPGVRRGAIDASWFQGRGAFGGLASAILLDAMRDDVADPRCVPRSLTVHFCAPAAAGPIDVESEIVRAGKRVVHATARIRRDGETTTMATASFGRTRDEGPSYARAVMPKVPPAAELTPIPIDLPGVPTFLRKFDVRFAGPVLPFSGSDTPEIAAWVRLREPEAADASIVTALLDSLPPAVLALADFPRPVASVDFSVQFFEDSPETLVTSEQHALVSIVSRWAKDGYAEELRELWSPGGVLLAQCRQLIALLG